MTTESKKWSEPDILHHRGKCGGRISHPETGTDDCHVCVRPVEGTRTACRKCAEYDEQGVFIRYIQDAQGSQAIPRAINFELDGVIGGPLAARTFTQGFPSVGTFSSAASSEYRQQIIDGVPSSGTLKNRQTTAKYVKRAWELGAPLRSDFVSAQAAYDHYDQLASCVWTLASIKTVARVWQYGKATTYSTVSDTWTYVCGNNGPVVELDVGWNGPERLGSLTAFLATGATGTIDSGIQEWTWPQDIAGIWIRAYVGDGINKLFPIINTAYAPYAITSVGTADPWSWRNGNQEDYVSELSGGGRAGGPVGGGDSSYVLNANTTMWYFTTGDPFQYEDPIYYQRNCRRHYEHRSACAKTVFMEGWAYTLTSYNTGRGTVQELTLWGIATGLIFGGLSVAGAIIKSTITKSGYPTGGTAANFDGQMRSNYHGSGECPYAGVSLTTTTYTTTNCPPPPWPIDVRVWTVTNVAPSPTGLGAGGCCNIYPPIPFVQVFGNPGASGAPIGVGRLQDTDAAAIQIASPTNYDWKASQYWDVGQLNRECNFVIFQSLTAFAFGIFKYMPGEAAEFRSKIGWAGSTNQIGVQQQVYPLATWRSKPSKGWDHCENNRVELELFSARDSAHGTTWYDGQPNGPSEFPDTGELWW